MNVLGLISQLIGIETLRLTISNLVKKTLTQDSEKEVYH
jgi:hypothetical protein